MSGEMTWPIIIALVVGALSVVVCGRSFSARILSSFLCTLLTTSILVFLGLIKNWVPYWGIAEIFGAYCMEGFLCLL